MFLYADDPQLFLSFPSWYLGGGAHQYLHNLVVMTFDLDKSGLCCVPSGEKMLHWDLSLTTDNAEVVLTLVSLERMSSPTSCSYQPIWMKFNSYSPKAQTLIVYWQNQRFGSAKVLFSYIDQLLMEIGKSGEKVIFEGKWVPKTPVAFSWYQIHCTTLCLLIHVRQSAQCALWLSHKPVYINLEVTGCGLCGERL